MNMFKPDTPAMPVPTPPPPVPTIDKARHRTDQQDALARKRGARASVLTGPEGAAPGPLATKTLIGS